jgi:hypothetical protein
MEFAGLSCAAESPAPQPKSVRRPCSCGSSSFKPLQGRTAMMWLPMALVLSEPFCGCNRQADGDTDTCATHPRPLWRLK